MSETNSEIKLALTQEGLGDDVRKVIKGLKERNVNRVALITKLWEFHKKYWKDVVVFLSFVRFFSSDEVKEVSSLLLERVKEEKEGKEIAAVLAVCYLVMRYDGVMAASLVEGGLAAPLVEIINSHRDEVDVIERGLFTAGDTAVFYGKECVDCEEEDAVVFVVIPTFHLFRLLSSDGTNELSLGIVSILEKIMESHSNNNDVMWAASLTCWKLAEYGR